MSNRQPISERISDPGVRVWAFCLNTRCQHSGLVDARSVIASKGDMAVPEFARRLRCSWCGSRGEIRFVHDGKPRRG